MSQPVHIPSRMEQIAAYFSPEVIGEVNDVYVKLARINGQDVPWHTHPGEDELFYVLEGELLMEVEGSQPFAMRAGDMFVVPRGQSHRVSSEADCTLLLVENKETAHLGDTGAAITRSIEEQLRGFDGGAVR